MLPLWMRVIAGSWLMASVQTVLMRAMSSTIWLVHGSSSLTHVPLRPNCLKLKIVGATESAIARRSSR